MARRTYRISLRNRRRIRDATLGIWIVYLRLRVRKEYYLYIQSSRAVELGRLDTETHRLETIGLPYSDMSRTVLQVGARRIVFGAGSPTKTRSIVSLNLVSHEIEILRRSSTLDIDSRYVSVAQPIEFPAENGLTAHAFFYPPKNGDYVAPPEERPPVLVQSHGGPTGATSSALDLTVQYWTSRGIAVLDVNYGGSTGYGRAYRERIDGKWGDR